MKKPDYCILDDDEPCDECGTCGEDFDESD